MPGTNNSKFVINDSKLAKKFGINVRGLETLTRLSKKNGTKFNICVPKNEMAHIQELWQNYETVLKKNRHRKVVDKLRKATNLGKNSFNESDGSRIASLVNIFQKTDDYITTAEEFFQGCKGHKQIKIYANKINKDYEILNGKGYLKGYERNNAEINVQFDREKFAILYLNEMGPHNDHYAGHMNRIYQYFYLGLNNKFDESAKKLNEAIDSINEWDQDLDRKLKKINKYFFKIKECDSALNDLTHTIEKHKEEWIRKNFNSLRSKFDTLLEYSSSISKISNMKYLEAIFYDDDTLNYAKLLTKALIKCAEYLDDFGSGIQSGLYTIEKLRKIISTNLMVEFKKLEDIQSKISDIPNNKSDSTNHMKKIEYVYKKLNDAFIKLSSAMAKYNKDQDKFLTTYYNWKKEKQYNKSRKILSTLFGMFGILSTGVVKLFPLISALIEQAEKPPVDPMPS